MTPAMCRGCRDADCVCDCAATGCECDCAATRVVVVSALCEVCFSTSASAAACADVLASAATLVSSTIAGSDLGSSFGDCFGGTTASVEGRAGVPSASTLSARCAARFACAPEFSFRLTCAGDCSANCSVCSSTTRAAAVAACPRPEPWRTSGGDSLRARSMRRSAAATIGFISCSSGVGTRPSCLAGSEGFLVGFGVFALEAARAYSASACSAAWLCASSPSSAASRARRCWISRKRSLNSLRQAGRLRLTPGNSMRVELVWLCVVVAVAFELSVIAGALASVRRGAPGRAGSGEAV